jgi:hypothetical protein
MMNIMKLPVDILIHKIYPNIGIAGTILMTSASKKFHKERKQILSYVINNDDFLRNYTLVYGVDLISLLSKNSISYRLFDELYEYIQCGSNKKKLCQMKIQDENTQQLHINNTFIVLKILKKAVNFKIKDNKRRMKCSLLITSIMKKYFNCLFFARNKECRFYVSYMMDIDHIGWEDCDINLYNICEDLNIMSDEKHKDVFLNHLNKYSFRTKTCNMNNVIATSGIIIKIFVDPSLPMKVYIYSNYILYKYLNEMFENNVEIDMLKNSQYIESSLSRLSIYEEIKDNCNFEEVATVPKYLKQMIDIEVNKYKINIIKNFDK